MNYQHSNTRLFPAARFALASLLLIAIVALSGCAEPAASSATAEEAKPGQPAADATADSSKSPVAETAAARSTVPTVPVRQTAMQEERSRSVSFDNLAFDVEADEPFEPAMITPMIEAFDGRDIKIRGFMLPTYKAQGITEFVLVRDNQVCCFGPGAKICHNMQVYMVDDATATYTTRAVEVEGRFTIETWTGEDGVIYSCYRIDATSVRGV